MNDGHVLDQLADFVLGGMSANEQRVIEQHLSGCAICRAEWLSLQEAAGKLALAAPQVEPPAHLKHAILQQVSPPPAGSGWFESLRRWMQRSSPAWGLAGLAVILVLIASNLLLWNQVRQLSSQDENQLQTVALIGSEAHSQASGLLVLTDNGRSGTLVVDGLPELDTQHQYQLWLIEGEARTNGGVFTVDREGYGTMVIEVQRPLNSFPRFGVTVEPVGGSSGPTGERVLSGEL